MRPKHYSNQQQRRNQHLFLIVIAIIVGAFCIGSICIEFDEDNTRQNEIITQETKYEIHMKAETIKNEQVQFENQSLNHSHTNVDKLSLGNIDQYQDYTNFQRTNHIENEQIKAQKSQADLSKRSTEISLSDSTKIQSHKLSNQKQRVLPNVPEVNQMDASEKLQKQSLAYSQTLRSAQQIQKIIDQKPYKQFQQMIERFRIGMISMKQISLSPYYITDWGCSPSDEPNFSLSPLKLWQKYKKRKVLGQYYQFYDLHYMLQIGNKMWKSIGNHMTVHASEDSEYVFINGFGNIPVFIPTLVMIEVPSDVHPQEVFTFYGMKTAVDIYKGQHQMGQITEKVIIGEFAINPSDEQMKSVFPIKRTYVFEDPQKAKFYSMITLVSKYPLRISAFKIYSVYQVGREMVEKQWLYV